MVVRFAEVRQTRASFFAEELSDFCWQCETTSGSIRKVAPLVTFYNSHLD
jgi:hypothetical protein